MSERDVMQTDKAPQMETGNNEDPLDAMRREDMETPPDLPGIPSEEESAMPPSVSKPPSVAAARHVSRWYGDVIAVNDLSFTMQEGITGLLGPNGAGKSTLIKMLVGLMRPSSGKVHVLGEDPWGNSNLLNRIGYVPEAPAPWRELSGRDCAVRAARFAGLSAREVEEAVETRIRQVGLTEAQDRQVGTYSHGMQQRLKFALALLHDPELLILDEPLLGSDPIARRDLIHLMQALAAAGHSILLSTHVLPDVEALTQEVMVLNHGRMMAHGDVTEIRDLLDRYPRTVRIKTPDPRRLGAAIWGWDTVLSLAYEPDALTVHTKRSADFYAALQDLLVGGAHDFVSVTSPDDNVETVFRYLVG